MHYWKYLRGYWNRLGSYWNRLGSYWKRLDRGSFWMSFLKIGFLAISGLVLAMTTSHMLHQLPGWFLGALPPTTRFGFGNGLCSLSVGIPFYLALREK